MPAIEGEGTGKEADLLDLEDEGLGPFELQEGALILVIRDPIKTDFRKAFILKPGKYQIKMNICAFIG